MRRIIAIQVATLLLAGCAARDADNHVTDLGDSIEPLRAYFNAQRGRPRIVGLFSPT